MIHKKYLLGLISLDVDVLDTDNPDKCKKYKHMIRMKLFWFTFSAVIRSGSEGIYIINNKEVM